VAAALAGSPRRASAASPEATISEVRFEGLSTLKPDELKSKVAAHAGMAFDPAVMREDLKRLAPMAWDWPEARTETADDGGVRIVYVLHENPKLETIEWIGNTKVSSKDLEKVLHIKVGDVLTRDAVAQVRESVLKEYTARGYARTEVQAQLVAPSGAADAGRKLQVLVNEGDKLRVEEMQIDGNTHFSSLRLHAEIGTKGSWLFIHNYYNDKTFEEDLKKLRHLYQSVGYFDVTVDRGPFRYDQARQTVTPTIAVVEGPRYRFGKTTAHGCTVFTPEEIDAPFAKFSGDYFDAASFAYAMKKVQALYANAGFEGTEIAESLEFRKPEGAVDVTLNVDEKGRAKVGRLLVERKDWNPDADVSWYTRAYHRLAPPVKEEVLRNEVTLKPGQVYDKRREAESEAHLRALGIFEDAHVESRATDDPDTRDVVIKVSEGPSGNVMLGVGYSDWTGAYVTAGFTERNVGGRADILEVNGLVGTKETNARVRYFDRHFDNGPDSLDTEVHRTQGDRPGFQEINTGASTELGIPITDRWKAYVRARAEYVQLDEQNYHPSENFNKSYAVAALRFKVEHDARMYEDFGMPKSFVTGGHLASVSVEGGVADGALAKLEANYNKFFRVADRWVLSSDWQAGLMPNNANDIGATERFYLGGTDDLRGFQFREAGPHDPGDHRVPSGGATKLLTRNEMRYAINEVFTGLVFVDAGMLDHDAASFDTPRASTGVGVRLGMKGVEAGVDLALPLNAQQNDQKRYFHVTLSGARGLGGGN
jgi:outer membrane protein insertion porin family